jgi:hypothetical protein
VVILGVLSIVWGAFSALFSPLPTGNLGLAGFASTVVSDGFFSHLAWANSYLPITAAISAFLLLSGLAVTMVSFRAIMWVLTKLHIVGGGNESGGED